MYILCVRIPTTTNCMSMYVYIHTYIYVYMYVLVHMYVVLSTLSLRFFISDVLDLSHVCKSTQEIVP